MKIPIHNPVDNDQQITENTEPIAVEAIIASPLILQQYSLVHKISFAIKTRLLVPFISKHWEPPK